MRLPSFIKPFAQLNLATKITLFRVGIIAPIILLAHFYGPVTCWLAMLLFVAASVSDYLDGYFARKEGQVTTFGSFLDPLADKLLICSVLIEMVGLGWVPAWIVIIILVRELSVTGLRAVAADRGVVIAADRFGKWKTGFQIAAVIPLLLHYDFLGIPFAVIGWWLLIIAAVLTVLSGVNYFYTFYADLKNGDVSPVSGSKRLSESSSAAGGPKAIEDDAV